MYQIEAQNHSDSHYEDIGNYIPMKLIIFDACLVKRILIFCITSAAKRKRTN